MRITSITVLSVKRLYADHNLGVGVAARTIVWLVRAEGTFMSTPYHGGEPFVAPSGYLVIRDKKGDVLAMGFD